MKENIIKVKEICERYNDYAQAGNEIFVISKPCMKRGETVIFDMEGIDSVSTVFLNTSFGQLFDNFGVERVKQSFRFTRILRSQAERIKKYFSNYAEVSEDNSEERNKEQ